MSQRKDKKRKRVAEESPESGLASDVKRKRLEAVLDVLRSGKDGGQSEAEVPTVRRSGRTPKAKVFDDDYVTQSVRVPESHRVAALKSATFSSSNPHEEAATSDIMKESADLKVGYKRETRRSYQQFLEELAHQSRDADNPRTQEKDETIRWNLKKVKMEVNEEAYNPTTARNQPASAQSDGMSRNKKQKERSRKEVKKQPGNAGGSDELGTSGHTDTALSPKVRVSSRTPVPKRTFPLLQTSLHQPVNEREQLNQEESCSPSSFPKVKMEEQEDSSYKVRTSARTPVPKRSFSLLEGEGSFLVKEENAGREEEEPQDSQTNSPSEPSPARSSSRTPVPKRAFPLLGGNKKEKRKEKSVFCKREEIGDGGFVGLSETPESSSSKKRKGTAAVFSLAHVVAHGGAPLLSSPDGKEANTKQKHSSKVAKTKLPNKFEVSGEVAPDNKKKIKRKSSKKNLQDLVIKQETMSGDDPSTKQGVHMTPKSKGKSLLLKETATNSPSRSENLVSLADLTLEVSKNLTSSKLLDNVTSASISSMESEPKVKSGEKIKKHAAKKHVHHDSSPNKSKKNFVEASSEVMEEEKHIILKLHLPHSSEHASKSASKKHKHKHSSESRDGAVSPKKKHHKKSTDEHRALDAVSLAKEPAAKKKISIKFKGLSTSHIDLEVGGASSGDSAKVSKKPAGKVKKKSGQSAASNSVEGSGKQKKKLPEEKPEAGQVTKPMVQKNKESNKPSSKQKEKARPASSKKPGKKSSPSKKKENEKPKLVTSYLLFCKQERSRIARQYPGAEFSQISKKVGEAWNKLPDEEKQVWRDKADCANRKVKKTDGSSLFLEPIDMAAHLRLLGESLLTIGVCLGQQNEMEVHGSLSVLLDSALCALPPLLFLTSQVPELNACPKPVQAAVLDNLGHIMPGIG